MNQTHLHLLINHLPVFGSVLGAVVLAYGLWAKSNHTTIAAYIVLIISSIGAGIAYLTGEAAEEVVENIQGVAKEMIEQHEDIAVFASIAFIISGILSLIGIVLTLRRSSLTRAVALIILFISLISFGLVAGTGYSGGQIRHTEINSTPALQGQAGEKEDSD